MIIGTIGLGLLVLIIVWIIALITFVAGIKLQNNVAWIALASAATITLVLVLLPVEEQNKVEDTDNLDKDYGFMYRVILQSLIILSGVAGFIFVFLAHCIEPIVPRPIKQFGY